jgi:hypothetical protein
VNVNPSTSPGAASPPPPDPADAPWKQRVKDGILALSLANLVLTNAWFHVLFDEDHSFFNSLNVAAPALLALLANLGWLALVFWLVLRGWRRTRNRAVQFGINLLFFALLMIPADFFRLYYLHGSGYEVMAFLKHPAVFPVAGCLLLLVLWQHRRTARVVATVVVLLAPVALLTVAHTVLLLAGVMHLEQDDTGPSLAALQSSRPELPRVIWIIFDETDYRLAFEQRPAGVVLPNFDQLRRQSLFATNAYPPGGATLVSMPALIAGRELAAVEVAGPSTLLLDLANGGVKPDWRELPSVFSRARALGANTALVGWYIPYSRILAEALNECVWFPSPLCAPVQARTFGAALVQELASSAATFNLRRVCIDACRRGQQAAEALAAKPQYNLMLFHLLPPHKPTVYLPAEDRFTVFGTPKARGYFNNLMLADHMLGAIWQAVERAGLQGKTWFVVSSDHWWRESAFFDGQLDHRVPFIVHSPENNQGLEFGGMINTVLTHDLLLAILRGELHNVAETARWLDQRQIKQPPVYGKRVEKVD